MISPFLAALLSVTPALWPPKVSPGDVVTLADGSYPAYYFTISDVTYKAEHPGKATFNHMAIAPTCSNVTLDGLAIENAPGSALVVRGNGHKLLNLRIEGAAVHGILVQCTSNDVPCTSRPTGISIVGADVSAVGNTGIKWEACSKCELISSRVHHNGSSGFYEGAESDHGLVQADEFDHNGYATGKPKLPGHGLYLKGQSGQVLKNLVHHNAGYGVHCWAACFGTADAPYRIEWNKIYGNEAGGTVIAGTSSEAAPPNDGYPHFVSYSHNTETGNGIRGGG